MSILPTWVASEELQGIAERRAIIASLARAISQPGKDGQETGPQPLPLDDGRGIVSRAEIPSIGLDGVPVVGRGSRLLANGRQPVAAVGQGIESGNIGADPSRRIQGVAAVAINHRWRVARTVPQPPLDAIDQAV